MDADILDAIIAYAPAERKDMFIKKLIQTVETDADGDKLAKHYIDILLKCNWLKYKSLNLEYVREHLKEWANDKENYVYTAIEINHIDEFKMKILINYKYAVKSEYDKGIRSFKTGILCVDYNKYPEMLK